MDIQCEEEIFEINDFSTSSDWERFIADIEEILTHWNLTNCSANDNENFSSENSATFSPKKIATSRLLSDPKRWSQRQESIKYRKVSFLLQFFQFKKNLESSSTSSSPSINQLGTEKKQQQNHANQSWIDMNSIENDWSVSGHPLVRYYGLSQFLLLIPLNNEIIGSEDRARHLLGSAAIALQNLDCEIPFFCQIGQLRRRLFMGVGHHLNGFRTYFDMIQFSKIPPSYKYFNDLMVLFKKKLYSSFSYQSNILITSKNKDDVIDDRDDDDDDKSKFNESKVLVSIRFTYLLDQWPTEYLLFNQSIVDDTLNDRQNILQKFSYFNNDNKPVKIMEKILINFSHNNNQHSDPIKQWQLATTWPSVAEELITDNAYHSDLKPFSAPRWSLRSLFYDDNSKRFCFYTELFSSFIKLSTKSHNNVPLLNTLKQHEPQPQDIRNALDKLSTPSPSMATTTLKTTTNLVTNQLLMNLISLSDDSKMIPEEYLQALMSDLFTSCNDNIEQNDRFTDKWKSAPLNSLSWRFANLFINIYGQTKQTINLAQIWKSFLNKLRNHWQAATPLPFVNVNDYNIDHGSCLFHQKLQMLNCCIRQKIKREITNQQQDMKSKFEDSDDEFFDAEDDEVKDETSSSIAEGQLCPLKDSKGETMYLLSDPNRPIYVPQIQDPQPMTEDKLTEQIITLSKIDDVIEKQRLQSSGLLSDMEAFKAANPGCVFEDFIRWHSPRDWILQSSDSDHNNFESKQSFGLSRRMIESNTWNDLWKLSRPCPIKRQKRLFNYTKDAEEILQYFETLSLSKLIELLLPIVHKSLVQQLIEYQSEIVEFLKSNNINNAEQFLPIDLDKILSKTSNNHNASIVEWIDDDYQQYLSDSEFKMLKFYSLLRKFSFAYDNVYEKQRKLFIDLFNSDDYNKGDDNMKDSIDKSTPVRPKLSTNRMNIKTKMNEKLNGRTLLEFILKLIDEPEVEFVNQDSITKLIVQIFFDYNRFNYEQTFSIGERLSLDTENSENPMDYNDERDGNNPTMKSPKNLSLPEPTGKEFIIRASGFKRPAPYSRPSSHRLYCFQSKDFRIASAFTEDTAYF